jgi:hypothetical protein
LRRCFPATAKAFQALSAQAAAFHSQIVQALNASAGAYASAEAANVGALRTLAQDLPVPNVALSVSGFTLLHLGSATASSGALGQAFAWGANSAANGATGGFSTTVAIGTNSLAVTGPGTLNVAIALGTNSVASAAQGTLAQSIAVGTNSVAYSGYGNNVETATAIGANSSAYAVNGFLNLASAVGPDSTAIAAGPGGFNVANVGGLGSTAIAGASPTAIGQGNLAVVYGNMLNATVTGVSQGINIVTPFFNAYLLPLSGLKLCEVIPKCGGLTSARRAVHINRPTCVRGSVVEATFENPRTLVLRGGREMWRRS